ncbi:MULTISPECIES: hypothetical protein [unclassified Enterococcus]|uniref:hypothetical protein n=1 Tax=unclassified Enterococcus TaxID=2608891 RepID=UPI0006B98DF3|nr:MULTISPECIES: hypothetical protein [unclassified Enterococcus]KPG69930.1 hypothetical protein AEQ18_10960 [Enterococcus sp. RIT-PI-f]HCE12303.1 hypothetical protein [Enterococcus sp.]
MLFDMTIPASEFQQKQLKVLASIPLQVMIKELDQVTYQFTTVPDQMMYDLAEYLSEDSLVEVKLIPGSVVEFYPVVNAL